MSETTLIAKQQNGRPVARVSKALGADHWYVDQKTLLGWRCIAIRGSEAEAERVAEELAAGPAPKLFYRTAR